MKNCDSNGPLMIDIVAVSDQRGNALGRIFSGTLEKGQKVKFLFKNYINYKNNKRIK